MTNRFFRNFLCISSIALNLAHAGAVSAHSITVGSVTLTPCQSEYAGYCGSITQPLDRSGHLPDKITIGFEFYPHTDFSQPPLGVILAEEGGPGFSTTGSRDGYVRLFDALRDRRDIPLIDKRGTGLSSAINCPDLQNAYDPSQDDIAHCAKELGAKAWLYGSPEAADDIAAELLHTLVLDSAYPVLNDDSDTELNGGQKAMDLVC